MSATGGLGKQVHCLAMSCCDLAMDEGLLTDPQTMTLSISDLLCGAQETYFGSFRVRIQAPLPGQSDNKPLSDLGGQGHRIRDSFDLTSRMARMQQCAGWIRVHSSHFPLPFCIVLVILFFFACLKLQDGRLRLQRPVQARISQTTP